MAVLAARDKQHDNMVVKDLVQHALCGTTNTAAHTQRWGHFHYKGDNLALALKTDTSMCIIAPLRVPLLADA